MRVGADIESSCRRCGDVWHIVLAMSDGQIAKVECKDCGAQHRYRRIAGRSAGPSSAPSRTRKRLSASRQATPIVEANRERPRQSFDTSDVYQVGDRVTHPHFGEGVVQALIGPTKVEILFEAGTKTMVHARSSG